MGENSIDVFLSKGRDTTIYFGLSRYGNSFVWQALKLVKLASEYIFSSKKGGFYTQGDYK